MGYACPVCDTPQADERHLADHLAVTAMVHGDAHETWLDDHVEDWSSMGPDDLGPVVAEYATETEYDEIFDDTVHDHGQAPQGERFEDQIARQGSRGPGGRGDLTADQQEILEDAREMTEEMLDGGDAPGPDEEEADDEGSDADDGKN